MRPRSIDSLSRSHIQARYSELNTAYYSSIEATKAGVSARMRVKLELISVPSDARKHQNVGLVRKGATQ